MNMSRFLLVEYFKQNKSLLSVWIAKFCTECIVNNNNFYIYSK